MPTRLEVISQLKKQASEGGIKLDFGKGRKAREEMTYAKELYNKARETFLSEEYQRHYRVSVFGSARIRPDHPYYKFTVDLTRQLVEALGVDIVTGLGPGIMEAATKGADLAKINAKGQIDARTIGVGIHVPWEEDKPDVDQYSVHADFPTRIQELIDMSHATYVGPGGYGTEMELFTALQLRQAKHIEATYPIILHPFWKKIMDESQKEMYDVPLSHGERPLVNVEDLHLIYSDNIPEIVGIIKESYDKWYEEIGKHVKRRRTWFPLRRKANKSLRNDQATP